MGDHVGCHKHFFVGLEQLFNPRWLRAGEGHEGITSGFGRLLFCLRTW